jgi:hypothetical protein
MAKREKGGGGGMQILFFDLSILSFLIKKKLIFAVKRQEFCKVGVQIPGLDI